ncbi:UNKNOWN [Stylonychia lemnae]|uniref:CWH43-like N-terminal domain-containing protein n=1 Tax=Stylonychia lemnae TaxID=5949 RepID=A0A077ZUY5_STYLE|nr:UNKNOWN [Stylonychia lemnae]|eukprot:CDW73115.1 UNKNOWN [Stylonychia lemnae]
MQSEQNSGQYPQFNQDQTTLDTSSLLFEVNCPPTNLVYIDKNTFIQQQQQPQQQESTQNLTLNQNLSRMEQGMNQKLRNIFKMGESSWSDFFAFEDGVISFSLKKMTIIFSILADLLFLMIAWMACSKGEVQCNNTTWPMISDILALRPYDRLFIFMTTIYTLGIMQINMRAWFKKVYGLIPNKSNDRILWIGLPACIALPLIGIFDEKAYRPIHYLAAGTFFSCFTLYGVWLSDAMYDNIENFPESDRNSIRILKRNVNGIFYSCILMILSTFTFGTNGRITPGLEWFTALYVINFYAIMAYTNPFYDSIHIPKKNEEEQAKAIQAAKIQIV